MISQEKLNIIVGDEETATREETIRVAIQDFPIPEDAFPVRIQVGDMPLTCVGWIGSPDMLPLLLRSIAAENEKMLEEWDAATPEASGTSADVETDG